MHEYSWIPTDLVDMEFMQDNCLSNGLGVFGDLAALSAHLRNQIYILGTGLNQNDSFRLEVKVTFEYIPTLTYKPWATDSTARATSEDLNELKNKVINDPVA